MYVCQVSCDGTGIRVQTVRTDNGDQCNDFTSPSADIPPRVGDPNLEGSQDRHEHREHMCKQCGSEFNRSSQLWLHLNAEHDYCSCNSRRFACPQCLRTYSSKGGLDRHVNLIHKKLSRFQCETCGKGLADRTRYLDHIVTHTGFKRHVCPICHMYFTYKSSLKYHVLNVHQNEAAASNL